MIITKTADTFIKIKAKPHKVWLGKLAMWFVLLCFLYSQDKSDHLINYKTTCELTRVYSFMVNCSKSSRLRHLEHGRWPPESQWDWDLSSVKATPGHWFWCLSKCLKMPTYFLLIFHDPMNTYKVSRALSNKTAPQHDAPTTMFNSGNWVFRVKGLSLPSPKRAICLCWTQVYQTKEQNRLLDSPDEEVSQLTSWATITSAKTQGSLLTSLVIFCSLVLVATPRFVYNRNCLVVLCNKC